MEKIGFLLCLFWAIIGLIWFWGKKGNFIREERQYNELQKIRMSIIKAGIEEAKRNGKEV
jgi:hypothetical protein